MRFSITAKLVQQIIRLSRLLGMLTDIRFPIVDIKIFSKKPWNTTKSTDNLRKAFQQVLALSLPGINKFITPGHPVWRCYSGMAPLKD